MNILKELRNLASKNYTTWKQVKAHLDTIPGDINNSLAGHIFQALAVEVLKHIEHTDIKNIYNLDLDKVSPKVKLKYGLSKKDMGVDLLLETKAGKVYGVQVKYRSQSKTLGFAEVSTFLAHQKLPGHIIFSNTTSVVDIIHAQTNDLKLYLLDRLLELSSDDWEAINGKILGKTTVKKYVPKYKPHQVKAVKNTVKMLKDEDRCQIIHPCGTGKTYVMANLVATMEPKLTIVAVPSLALEKQTKDVLVKQLSNTPSFGKFLYGVVGSDETVDKDNGDALTTEMGLCGLGVTTDYRDIAAWIKQAKSQKSKLIIFTTYQSIDSVEKAVKKTAAKVGLVIADEAHKTATHKKSTYTRIHSSKLLPASKRVYMTATPRVFSKDPAVQDVVYDMSDVKIFGKQADYLSFKEAIDQKLLTDYQMVAVSVNNEEVMKYALERKYVNVDGTIADMEQIIGAIALHKARKKYKINHTISYHTSNKNAEKFSALYSTLFKNEAECFVVNGSMNAGARIDQLQDFEEAKSALVSNARCLQEGVSINAVDSILFCDPKSSAVDIIQSAGRPMRLHPGKELGTIIVPVFHEKEEDLEGAIESGSWKDVVSVLRALGSADERVQEWMMNVKSGNGERSGSGERNGLIVERMPIAFLDFDKKYIDNVGLNVIGKSKAHWTREMVEKLLKQKKYNQIRDWKNDSSSQQWARRELWYKEIQDEYFPNRIRYGRVKEDIIKELITKKYKTLQEGRETNPGSYHWSQKNQWFQEIKKIYFPHSPVSDRTREGIEAEIKKEKYKSISQWVEKNSASYAWSVRRPWFLEIRKKYFSNGKNFNYTKERIIEELKSKKYSSISEWTAKSSSIYWARNQEWFNEIKKQFFKNSAILNRTVQDIENELKREKYKAISDWEKTNPASHSWALKRSCYPELRKKYFPNATKRDRTREEIEKELKKNQYKGISEWRRQNPSNYFWASTKPWYPEIKKKYFPNAR